MKPGEDGRHLRTCPLCEAMCGLEIQVDDGQAGEIRVPVEVTDAIKPGVVSMPHGWGHGKPGTRMAVANGSPGANTNVLSPPTFVDQPSGNGVLNGIPVTIIDDQVRFRPAQAL